MRCAYCALQVYGSRLSHRQHYIKPRPQRIVCGGDLHHELAMKELVGAILRLIRKIELGRQHRPLGRLDLDVIVAGAPGI